MMGVFPSQVANWATGKQIPFKRNQYKIGQLLNFSFIESADGWELVETNYQDTLKSESKTEEPNVPYVAIPSTKATLEDLERMLELVESTVRIARASITELRKKS